MNEQEKREKHKEYKERIVRWDQLRISQLSFTNNLFLTLDITFLGFFVSQTLMKFSNECWICSLQIISLLSLLTSFIIGTMTVVNRLYDFRCTARLVRNKKLRFEFDHNLTKHSDIESINENIIWDKKLTDKLGQITWKLLKWQIWTFVIGTSIGILYLIIFKNIEG